MSSVEFETLTPEVANTVIEGDHLSPPAKSYVEDPAHIEDFVDASADAPGASVLGEGEAVGEAIVEGSGEIPILAPLAALGAGVGIGSKVCGWLGISGCWFSENTEVQPPASQPSSTEWKFYAASASVSGSVGHRAEFNLVPYTYYLTNSSFGIETALLAGHGGVGAGCSNVSGANSGAGLFLEGTGTGASFTCKSGSPLEHAHETVQGRLGDAGKRSGFESAAAAASLPAATGSPYCSVGGTCSSAPVSNWSQEFAKNLTEPQLRMSGISAAQTASMAQYVSHKVAGTALPGEFTTTVPGCEGLSYVQCAVKLEEGGLVPAHHELGWHEAITADPPERVEELDPARSTSVEKGATVVVTTNPDEAGMPVVIPQPGPNETYSEYAARLNPALSPKEVLSSDLNENPAFGPSAVTTTSPAAGTLVDPATTTAVSVYVNPADAPPATGVGGGGGPPAIDSIDMSPLSGINPCGVFPFGLFCWIGDTFSEVAGSEAACPEFNPELPSITGGVVSGSLDLCTEPFPELRDYARPIELFLFTIGVAIMFARATRAFGPGE